MSKTETPVIDDNAIRDQADRPWIARRGLLLVLSSPSGAGKTTISRELLRIEPELSMSVSVTTRAPRPNEVDGADYHFIEETRYTEMVRRGELLEYAKVFDHHYGTPKAPVFALLEAGRDVLFDIDWQGTQQLRQSAESDLVSVFVLPPSWDELYRRLSTRGQDSAQVIAGRMARASDEMSHWAEYDYIVVNHDVDRSVEQVGTILSAERMRRHRQTEMAEFVRGLRKQDG